MSIAFLFPGQGSEAPLMGGRALLRSPRVSDWLARASAIVGIDVRDTIERGLPALRRTEVVQPALTAVSLGLQEALAERGLRPSFVAGHSVGEMAAFATAGVCSPEMAVTLAAERGRLMQAAADANPGGMLALKVDSRDEVDAALAYGQEFGSVELGAANGPGEWVLTGDKAALTAVAARFKSVALPVVGPWHSRGMAEAEHGFRRVLSRTMLRAPSTGLVTNRDGALVADEADVVDLLAGQLTRPVAWSACMATLASLGASKWVIVGPGRALRGLVRKNVGADADVVMAQDWNDLEVVAA
jgi:[acyl-carrier-protein] S-malonyltransferase